MCSDEILISLAILFGRYDVVWEEKGTFYKKRGRSSAVDDHAAKKKSKELVRREKIVEYIQHFDNMKLEEGQIYNVELDAVVHVWPKAKRTATKSSNDAGSGYERTRVPRRRGTVR